MEKFPTFDPEVSPIKEAYHLLGATTPLELSNLYSAEDQKLMYLHLWDYNQKDQITNRIKDILELADVANLTDDEKSWGNEILWFWYHHAISCAIWRYGDKEAAGIYADRALEFQSSDHPNQITRLFSLLTHDQLEDAEKWAEQINDEIEGPTAQKLIDDFKNGKLFKTL